MTTLATLKALKNTTAKDEFPKLHELITMVHGDKKVGKSTLASRYKNPVFVNCEDALRTVRTPEGKAVPAVDVNSWADIVSFIATISKHTPEETGFNTVVIDGGSEFFQYLRNHILAKHNVEHENDGVLAYGKGKGIIAKELRDTFLKLRQLTRKGYGVVFTAHSRTLEFENAGVKKEKKVPLISGDKNEYGWEMIKPSVDLVVYCYKKETRGGVEHLMSTHGTEMYEACDPTPDARLPHNEKLSYKTLEDAYNKKVSQPRG